MVDSRGRLHSCLDAMMWRLLPGICVLCNERSGVAMDLCPHCRDALPWLEHPCLQCALPLLQPGVSRCAACEARPPPFTRTVAVLRYTEPVTRMVQRVKFAGSACDARVLGELLGERVADAYRDDKPDTVVPVPLSRLRLLRRGHNQAALFARWVGRTAAVSVDYDLCERTRHTATQTSLGRAARLRNLTGAFAVRAPLSGRRVAILDDVMTTGATATALARALLAVGADAVHVWAVARTMAPDAQRQPAHSGWSTVR